VLNTSSGCDVGHIDQLANSFFGPPRKLDVKTLVNLLATQTPYSLGAKNSGFDIMAQMEGAVNDVPTTAGDPGVGSNLINHLLLCMYNPATELASYPASFPDTFNVALTVTASAHGGFGHRSGSSTSAVYSRPMSAPFTGVAPPQTSSWGSVISPPSTTHPARVVLYGRPATGTGTTSQTYDWRTIPRNAAFNPYIIVGICIDPFLTANNTTMLNAQSQQSVAVLAFADAYFLIPGTTAGSCSSDLTLLEVNSPLLFARRMIRFGADLLTPRPLMATVLSPGGLGGRNSGAGTKYGPIAVPNAQLTFLEPLASNVQVNQNFPVRVRATSAGVGVNGNCITLGAINNNGLNTEIIGAHTCGDGTAPSSLTTTVNNLAGVAQFCVNDPKTGTIKLVATGDIEEREDTPVTQTSKKLNVKPSATTPACP
jgi:hypothetical protein